MLKVTRRYRISLEGVVQGVGFRPFLKKLADRWGLPGIAFNTAGGLVVELDAEREDEAARFVDAIAAEAPRAARIEKCVCEEIARGQEFRGFEIRASALRDAAFTLISPDLAVCADCLREIRDPDRRRYRYPFTNCTNCGPRYTITRTTPYDRAHTTMAKFPLCAACAAEYGNPDDRRFHAEPVACGLCGPRLSVEIGEVATALACGQIVAIKGLGGYQLACDAFRRDTVELLRLRKRRSRKPFAVMMRDIAAVERYCFVNGSEREVLESAAAPIVLLAMRDRALFPDAVAPGLGYLGVMLPYTPMHHLLFDAHRECLVMTSGNLSEEPIVIRNDEAVAKLSLLADLVVTHDRDIFMRVDDSVVCVFQAQGPPDAAPNNGETHPSSRDSAVGTCASSSKAQGPPVGAAITCASSSKPTPRLLRRSRGYAPGAIPLGHEVGEVLAVGPELKNTFCLTKGQYAVMSQHIGDMENLETLEFFEETLRNLQSVYQIAPQAIAHDLHPDYLTTRWALSREEPKVAVQHHHAHVASCMAENGLSARAIGVAFDGTGYGTDGQVWGGEFLVCDYSGFERWAHLEYVGLPGGDRAAKQGWRMAAAFLGAGYRQFDLPCWDAAPASTWQVIDRLIARPAIVTSSCGRLFDAVAAICGVSFESNYEGESAMRLEAAADAGSEGTYSPGLNRTAAPWRIETRAFVTQIARDIAAGMRPGLVARRFHDSVARIVAEVCREIRERSGVNRVCLSGGTFQNLTLLRASLALLRTAGFEVYTHAKVPPNDGGISLGQAVIAAKRLETGPPLK